ncbi:MAG TPA: hypothetical protein PKY38_12335 [Opitutaceae bacterium]|nr:hypothetical protein [Opitutaceae bacterium]
MSWIRSILLILALASQPMSAEYYTPDRLLNELQDELAPWVRAQKGALSIARDPFHFLELLAESPAGWRAVLHWDGETNPATEEQAGIFAPQRLSIGLTANLGLTAAPDQALVKATASRPALLVLLAGLRERVRGYVWPEGITNRFTLYTGCEPVILPEPAMPLAAYRLNFELIIALPPAEYRNLLT